LLTSNHIITTIGQCIIQTVLYFDVFKYPLTADEIYQNMSVETPKDVFLQELDQLIHMGLLKKKEGYILNSSSLETIVERRVKGNTAAERILPLAHCYAKKVASFPFVEGVCISGGLSKNYFDEKGDFDFFVIVKPGRLWISRTLLIVKYKFLPKHKKKYWCVNYFISSGNLSIPDRNLFVATEIAYLLPAVNYNHYKDFLNCNAWYRDHFPNRPLSPGFNCIQQPKTVLKSFAETLLGGRLGEWLDNCLLRITLKHWRQKYQEMNNEDFELQFRSRKDVCKRHTKGFQNSVLEEWEEKQAEYKKAFKMDFTHQ